MGFSTKNQVLDVNNTSNNVHCSYTAHKTFQVNKQLNNHAEMVFESL